jgi:hypothetical protein
MIEDDELLAALTKVFTEVLESAAAAAVRRIHDPQFGDAVLPHLVRGLYSEHPIESEPGMVLRLFDLANGRTGAQKCPAGAAQGDYPITVAD